MKNKLLCGILILFFVSVFVNLCVFHPNPSVAVICVLMLAGLGIDVKKIIRWTYRLQFILVLVVLLMLTFGITSDYLVYRGSVVRHSFGFTYTTTLPSFLTSFLLLYICDKHSNIPWYQIVLLFVANVLLLVFTDSRLEFGVTLLLLLGLVLWKTPLRNLKIFFKKGLDVSLSVFSKVFWILPILWLGLVMLYPIGGVFDGINKFSSNRFAQTYDVIVKKGSVTAFGSSLVLKGNDAGTRKKYGDYRSDFVDDDYLRGMVYHGVIFTVCEIILFEAVLLMLWKKRQRDLLLFCMVSLLAAFIDTRLMTIVYCPIFLIILPTFSDYYLSKNKVIKNAKKRKKELSI